MNRKTVEKPGWRQPVRVGTAGRTNRVMMQRWAFSLAMILLSGTTAWSQTSGPTEVAETDTDRPTAQAGPPQLITVPGYRLHQGDKIEVRFFYQPELNQETVVKPDGMISLQLIEDIRAEGLTVGELEQQLTQQYAQQLLDPLVSVVLLDYVKPKVFIGGEVTRPGPYDLRDGDMLAQALLLAGGFTPKAHRKQVLVARPIGEGELRVAVVDTTKIYSRDPDAEMNLALKDGDVIYVPESKLSRISYVLDALKFQTFGFVINPFRNR